MKKYTLQSGDYKDITSLYSKIKIPVFKHGDYYLEQLMRITDHSKTIDNFISCKAEHEDVSKYKRIKSEEVIKYYKDKGLLDILNGLAYDTDFKMSYPKTFDNHNPEKLYISIDVKQANFAIFNYVLGDNKIEGSWEDFVQKEFGLHPFVANSKQFRQIVFGNLNPGRQQVFQKRFMYDIYQNLFSNYELNVVMISADEILIETTKELLFENKLVMDFLSNGKYINYKGVALKVQMYTVSKQVNYDDLIKIKTYWVLSDGELCPKGMEFYSIPGTRYFIHYRSMFLHEELCEYDLLFEPEPKRIAKWVL